MTPRELSNQAAYLADAAKHNVQHKAQLDNMGLQLVTNLLQAAKQTLPPDSPIQRVEIPNDQVSFNWSGVLSLANAIQSSASAAISYKADEE